ncbi:hypothetical protein Vretimale_6389 [Volvox reticuliferus]|uniref:Uncharacterized protein n=1 Tax=Volvox reticuliferus TaxID=1737510 RepID=A0A8J4G7H0_9CHLO|nr:hypothetical protein Vretifemale_16078 [Volvox reticuliferus]GIM01595.1 hypothetical protein Vretimale_6389 [Volvox reticuliferus]
MMDARMYFLWRQYGARSCAEDEEEGTADRSKDLQQETAAGLPHLKTSSASCHPSRSFPRSRAYRAPVMLRDWVVDAAKAASMRMKPSLRRLSFAPGEWRE